MELHPAALPQQGPGASRNSGKVWRSPYQRKELSILGLYQPIQHPTRILGSAADGRNSQTASDDDLSLGPGPFRCWEWCKGIWSFLLLRAGSKSMAQEGRIVPRV